MKLRGEGIGKVTGGVCFCGERLCEGEKDEGAGSPQISPAQPSPPGQQLLPLSFPSLALPR